MNVKKYATLFLFLICGQHIHYVNSMTAIKSSPFEARPRIKRQTGGCVVSPQVNTIIETSLDNCRKQIKTVYKIEYESISGITIDGGTASGLSNFTLLKPPECNCIGNNLRIVFEINYLAILLTGTLNLVQGLLDGLLGGALSGLISTTVRLLDGTNNLLLRVLATDLWVQVVLVQRLQQGANCILVDYRIVRVSRFTALGLDLTIVLRLLESLLVPVLDLTLNDLILRGEVSLIFRRELQRISIPMNLVQLA